MVDLAFQKYRFFQLPARHQWKQGNLLQPPTQKQISLLLAKVFSHVKWTIMPLIIAHMKYGVWGGGGGGGWIIARELTKKYNSTQ